MQWSHMAAAYLIKETGGDGRKCKLQAITHQLSVRAQAMQTSHRNGPEVISLAVNAYSNGR